MRRSPNAAGPSMCRDCRGPEEGRLKWRPTEVQGGGSGQGRGASWVTPARGLEGRNVFL